MDRYVYMLTTKPYADLLVIIVDNVYLSKHIISSIKIWIIRLFRPDFVTNIL